MTTTTLIPASIRHKNPGAMGLGTSAIRFGATKSTLLNDGANNTIATFPTMVDGAGALFYLLHSVYADMSIWAALHKWGDGATIEAKGNAIKGRLRTDGYVSAIEQHSRFKGSDVLSKAILEDAASAIEFGKAMAWHETGFEYPMTDAQWAEAHGEFLTVIRGGSILIDRKQPIVMLKPLELARSHLGEKEIEGSKHNEFILQCFKDVDREDVKNDETAWCAAFLGAMLKAAGCAYMPDVLEARKYLNYGHELDEPEVGCIVIFWRVSPTGWQGHVAFVESFTATTLTIIGGNQGNAVSRITVVRTGKGSQVLGYRRPVSAVVAAVDVLKTTPMQQNGIAAFGAIGALAWSVWGAVERAAHVVGEIVGMLPDTASSVGSTVSAGQQLTQAAGMPWPVQLGLFITVCALGFKAYRIWQQSRQNSGEVTKAPYAVPSPAEALADFDEAACDAFAPASAPNEPTFTQAQVDEMIATATAKPKRKPRTARSGSAKKAKVLA
jgi:uncharacterized protein (TIGR02594 family)